MTTNSRRVVSVLSAGDIHFPKDAPGYVGAICELAAHVKPDYGVLAGDIGEYEAGSRHVPDSERPDFSESVEPVRAGLKRFKRASPSTQWVLLEGNHETMPARFLAEHAPGAAALWSVPEALGLDALGFEFVPEDKQPWRLGNLQIIHGHQVFGRFTPKYPANKVLDQFGQADRVTLVYHVHRASFAEKGIFGSGRNTTARAYTIGAGRTLNPSWNKSVVNGWVNEACLSFIRPSGFVDVFPLRFHGGAFLWAGREFRARR